MVSIQNRTRQIRSWVSRPGHVLTAFACVVGVAISGGCRSIHPKPTAVAVDPVNFRSTSQAVSDAVAAASQSSANATTVPQTTGTQSPGAHLNDTQLTGTQTPGTQTPGTQTPGTQTPGTQTPGTQTPGRQPAATQRTQAPGMSAHSGLIDPSQFRLAAAQGTGGTLPAPETLPSPEALPAPEGAVADAKGREDLQAMLREDPADGDMAARGDTSDGENPDGENPDGDIPRLLSPPLRSMAGDAGTGLPLDRVVASVQSFFPLLDAIYLERDRTAGDQTAAWGAFDTKLKGRTENQPLGFYENYQHSGGFNTPLYSGAEVYGGYRIGRGIYEPWYLERETNKGGEFKTGFVVPLLRDHDIDARRADLWRATYDRQLAEPAIRQEVIMTIRDATAAYWFWVDAGQQYEIGKAALELAERRNQQIKRRVEEGDLGEPDLADNRRAIIQRQGKLIDLERKLIQTAVKLSLFLRDNTAQPLVPTEDDLATFPEILPYDLLQMQNDITYAVQNRPELVSLDTLLRRVRVDFAEAANETLPAFDAISNISQDVGEPTSSTRDKSEFELEIGLEFEMPVQRRKGFGKMRSARAKLGQIEAKRRFTVEKISTEVQNAAAALDAAYQRVEAIGDAVQISEELAQIERRKFELGESDLLAVFLREQIAIEAASELMTAKLEYFLARADYTAALAYEFPVLFSANPAP